MNSLIPMIIPALATSRVEEHLAEAEKARLLRRLGTNEGSMSNVRRLAGAILVRAGEWVTPVRRPVIEPGNDQALIRLAR